MVLFQGKMPANPLNKKTEVGPLISPREVDRVEQWVKEAALSGGNRILIYVWAVS